MSEGLFIVATPYWTIFLHCIFIPSMIILSSLSLGQILVQVAHLEESSRLVDKICCTLTG